VLIASERVEGLTIDLPPRSEVESGRARRTLAGVSLELLNDLYLDFLRTERGLSGNTLEAYSHDLREYLDHLAKKSWTTPTTSPRRWCRRT